MRPARLSERRLPTPLGPMVAAAAMGEDGSAALCLLEFADRRALPRERRDLERHFGGPLEPASAPGPAADLLDEAGRQLDAYFAGELRAFTLSLDLPGTPFQRRVWHALLDIPYGETTSYGGLAERLGTPGAARAVGMANGANRVAIVVPCHRVVESTGALRGYGGGLERKRFLLDLERARHPAGTLWNPAPA
jgi:AraC family transcriptional regulator of adaptative response/methylated-DNA-[protein]-cysteine methyltransferase